MEPFQFNIEEARSFIDEDPPNYKNLLDSLAGRIKSVDKKVRAYILFDRRGTPSYENLPEGLLKGIPVSLKDNICTEGKQITCASNILQGYVPPYNATVVNKLYEAGAFAFAKCDMDEFAFGSSCETSCYNGRNDQGKKTDAIAVRNPWDLERIPGGSSGGSAACVAADEAICSLGSDTGGSIRQPAALCGVVGLKPTYGRVSRYGLVAFGSSLDQIGPFTKTVKDSARMLQVIAGHDPLDSTSADIPVPNYMENIDKDLEGIRIGIPKEYHSSGIDPDVQARIKDAITFYSENGAKIVDISLPHTKYAVAVYYIIGTAEASSNLARFDGIRYGKRAKASNLDELYFKTRNEGFGAEAKRRILLGTFVLSSGYYDAYYKKAQQVRTLFKKDFETAFKNCDVILTPTSPTPAFKVGEKLEDPIAMYLSDIFTIPANLAGIPAISIPCGFTKEKLPVGLQLMTNHFREDLLFQVANFFEKNTDHHTKRPKL